MTTYLLSRSKCSSSQCSNWGKKKTSDQQHQQLNVLKMIYSIYKNLHSFQLFITNQLSHKHNSKEASCIAYLFGNGLVEKNTTVRLSTGTQASTSIPHCELRQFGCLLHDTCEPTYILSTCFCSK